MMKRAARIRRGILLLLLVIAGGLVFHLGTIRRVSSTTYYVDSIHGNDAAGGTNPSAPFQTLSKVNELKLRPGDRVLLKRGSAFSEQLRAGWSGSSGHPIVIDAYGSGPLPVIQSQHDGNVRVTGSFLTIGHLMTTNSPASYGAVDPSSRKQPLGWVAGVTLIGASHVTLQDLTITHEAVAVAFTSTAHDNHVLHNQIANNDGAWKPTSDPNGIRGGTGVLLEGTNNEIGWNTFTGNGTRVADESISIELFTASSSLIHHNSSTDKVFVETGSDPRFISRDNQILFNQFNATRWSNPVFVITRGPGAAFGPVFTTQVEHNTVYATGPGAQGVVCSRCGPHILTLRENIIEAQKRAIYVDTGQPVEDHNLFWSPTGSQNTPVFTQNLKRSPTDMVANPMFVDAAHGDFRLRAGSPAVGHGSIGAASGDDSTTRARVLVRQT